MHYPARGLAGLLFAICHLLFAAWPLPSAGQGSAVLVDSMQKLITSCSTEGRIPGLQDTGTREQGNKGTRDKGEDRGEVRARRDRGRGRKIGGLEGRAAERRGKDSL